MAKDPICGMEVDEKTAIKRVIGGKPYYFCSQSCAETFEKQMHIKEMHRH
jgi:YHS domain-containing protein